MVLATPVLFLFWSILLNAFSCVLQRADLCEASKTLEPLGRNRCTWGPSYWCKDTETAQKCGVSYIQAFIINVADKKCLKLSNAIN